MCINRIVTELKAEITGIKISKNKIIKTLLFTDDQLRVAESEDSLLISSHKLETVTYKYGLKISERMQKQWLLMEEVQ
jgi:hypothetical protein